MNKYQRVINKISRYDFEIDRATNMEVVFNFNKTRIINRYLTHGLKFETLVRIKNSSLKLLKECRKNGGFSIE